MINLNDDHRGGNFCFSKAAIGIGDGAKTGVAVASTVGAGTDYCIDGIFYNLADSATNKPFTASTTAAPVAVQPVLSKCLYLIMVDTAGAVTTIAGTPVLTTALTAGSGVLKWPVVGLPQLRAPIGAVKITLTGAATFTPGVTALDASGVAAQYFDLHNIPVVPLSA